MLILFIPIAIPHFFMQAESRLVPVLILLGLFVYVALIDGPVLNKLYKASSTGRLFVLVVGVIVVVNFTLSFLIESNKWIIWVCGGWSLCVALWGAKIHNEHSTISRIVNRSD
jgi:hypothetical protein